MRRRFSKLFWVVGVFIFMGLTVGASAQNIQQEYKLGPGDKLRITVFGEKELSGNFELDGAGSIAIPLIGKVPAKKSSVPQLEGRIITKLRKYLKSPQVTVEVMNYRPFYILGEVKKPGNYPYVSGISILNAVAMAGGFSYRADKKDITVNRTSDESGNEVRVTTGTVVLPGDIITIKERFF